MADLIPPHGGVKTAVNRTVSSDRAAEFVKEVASLTALLVSDADLSSVYRMGDGGLSPLTGPMVKDVYDRVLKDAHIVVEGKKYSWTIPISLPVEASLASSLKTGQRVKLTGSSGKTVGALRIDSIFPYDKAAYIKSVYQTERTDHP